MRNLFTIFDPSIILFHLYLPFTLILLILLLPNCVKLINSTNTAIIKIFLINKQEINYVIKKNFKGIYLIIVRVLLTIFLINFLALFPHIYSTTSHLRVNFPLSYILWIGVILFIIYYSMKDFLCHLIPTGTPTFLIRFIILVEILSNLIRPMALTFRLTANIMAGHLLISLIGGSLISLPTIFIILGSRLQLLLTTMELGVSLIQAYVFTTLITLYLSEGSYNK